MDFFGTWVELIILTSVGVLVQMVDDLKKKVDALNRAMGEAKGGAPR